MSTINRAKLTEIVYFPEMADKPLTLAQRMEKVETALGISHKRTTLEWTRDHKLALSISVGTFILIAIAWFAWWQPQWKQSSADERQHSADDLRNQIDRQIDAKLLKPLETLEGIRNQVTSINTRIETFIELEKSRLDKISKLGSTTFNNQLPEIAEAMKTVAVLKIPPPPDFLPLMQMKLINANSRAAGYWSATSTFIAYRSAQQAPKAALSLLKPRPEYLPPERCNSQIPSTIVKPGESQKQPLPAVLIQCIFDLSEDVPPWWVNLKAMDYGIGGFRFEDCVILYQGGSIPEKVLQVLTIATFERCIYLFSFDSPPPATGQQISRAILAAKSTTVSGLVKPGG